MARVNVDFKTITDTFPMMLTGLILYCLECFAVMAGNGPLTIIIIILLYSEALLTIQEQHFYNYKLHPVVQPHQGLSTGSHSYFLVI